MEGNSRTYIMYYRRFIIKIRSDISEEELFIETQGTFNFNLLNIIKNLQFNLSESVTEIYCFSD